MTIRGKIKGTILEHAPRGLLTWCKKRHYRRELESFGIKQEPDLRVVRRLVQRGDTVIDIGAHVGWYTVVLSRLVSDSGRVLSFEPVPETFALLRWCVQRLHLRNVTLFNRAISNETGMATMEVPRYDTGGDNFYQARIVKCEGPPNGLSFRVPVSPLDEVLGSMAFSRIGFVKCDVEGNELEVVAGAEATISRFKPVWLIEVSTDPDKEKSPASDLFRLLGGSGYTPYWLDGDRLKRRCTGERSVNYFFLTAEHLRRYWGRDFGAGSFPI